MHHQWKCPRAIPNPATGASWIRVHLRGLRPLSLTNRLRFRYRLTSDGPLAIVLRNSKTGQQWITAPDNQKSGSWTEAVTGFTVGKTGQFADELQFVIPKGSGLLVDDVLLFEPGD